MFRQPKATVADAWKTIVSLLQSGAIKPIVAKTFPWSKRRRLCVISLKAADRRGSSYNLTTLMGKT